MHFASRKKYANVTTLFHMNDFIVYDSSGEPTIKVGKEKHEDLICLHVVMVTVTFGTCGTFSPLICNQLVAVSLQSSRYYY